MRNFGQEQICNPPASFNKNTEDSRYFNFLNGIPIVTSELKTISQAGL